jgi:hypothetical protein
MGIEQIRLMKQMAEYPKHKKMYSIPKKSAKKIQQEKLIDVDDLQWKWFEEIRKSLTGVCKHCGGKTTKDDDVKFHFSIAHILPKGDIYFPSVKMHPLNFIELCTFGNNCHGNYDNKTLDLIDMNCFDEIVRKFVAIYPSIEKSERRRIPQVLMNYIEVEI